MPPAAIVDAKLRERLRRWLWHFRDEYRSTYANDGDFADFLGISPTTLSTYLSGARSSFGLDVVVALHRACHAKIDDMVDKEPEAKAEHPPPPRTASEGQPPAPSRKRGTQGGSR